MKLSGEYIFCEYAITISSKSRTRRILVLESEALYDSCKKVKFVRAFLHGK